MRTAKLEMHRERVPLLLMRGLSKGPESFVDVVRDALESRDARQATEGITAHGGRVHGDLATHLASI